MPAKGDRKPRVCRVCGEDNPEKFSARNAGICNPCVYVRRAPKAPGYFMKSRNITKTDVLAHYGPQGKMQCSWDGCEINDIDMLVLDHIEDDGAKERRNAPNSGKGHELYRKLRNENYPAGYQTLCCNHNHKKELLRVRHKF
jgi:hypothetical protein